LAFRGGWPLSAVRDSRHDRLEDATDRAEVGHIALLGPARDLIQMVNDGRLQTRFRGIFGRI
jgi:hypothetical protein